MAVKRATASFRTLSAAPYLPADWWFETNLSDYALTPNWSAPFAGGFSAGAVLIDDVLPSLSIPAGEPWEFISVSVTAMMVGYLGACVLNPLPSGYGTMAGKLGSVLCGVAPQRQQTFGGQEMPCDTPFVSPQDASLVTELWTPDTNPLPPLISYNWNPSLIPPMLPINATLSAPSPVVVNAGIAFNLGLWITPSLMYNPWNAGGEGSVDVSYPAGQLPVSLAVLGAQWVITYEDKPAKQRPLQA